MHRADRQFLLTSIFVLCTLIVSFATMFAHAGEWWVDAGAGNDTTGNGTEGSPWRTITHAFDQIGNLPASEKPDAGDPGTVYVKTGTYTYETGGSHNESFPISWYANYLNYLSLVGKGPEISDVVIDYGDWDGDALGLFEIWGGWNSPNGINGVTIASITCINGYSDYDGGSIWIKEAEATIKNCVIYDSVSHVNGGAVCVTDNTDWEVNIENCEIRGNIAEQGGGIASYIPDYSGTGTNTINIRRCIIEDNETVYVDGESPHGGGMYLDETVGVIEDNEILHNQTYMGDPYKSGYGGGIYAIFSSPHISHNRIRSKPEDYWDGDGNRAYNGGGIYIHSDSALAGPVIIDQGNEIAQNYAGAAGGGIYIWSGAEVIVEDNHIFINDVETNGGGIFSNQGEPTIRGNYIVGNYAYNDGGGIYIQDSVTTSFRIEGLNRVFANEAHGNGGGIYTQGANSNSTLEDNQVWGNIAADGDGIYMQLPDGIVVKDNAVWGNDGHGVFVNSGTSTLFNNLIFADWYWPGEGLPQTHGVYFRGNNTLNIENCTIAGHSEYGIYVHSNSSGILNVLNTIVWDNLTSIRPDGATVNVDYSDIEGGWSGTGNKDVDPLFVGGPADWGICGAYFLSQEAAGQDPPDSPCVNAGSDDATNIFTTNYYDYSTRTDADPDTETVDMGFHYRKGGATYIKLDSFEARGLNGKVVLSWKTATEIDNAGFDLYRVEEGQSERVKVNASIIAAKGSVSSGASYSFIDTNVERGKTYLYYLVDIDTSGKTSSHGPVKASPLSIVRPEMGFEDGPRTVRESGVRAL